MSTDDNVFQLSSLTEINDMLASTIRQGAKRILSVAIEQEVNEFIAKHAEIKDTDGRRQIVCNGYLPEHSIQTGIGDIYFSRCKNRFKDF